MALIPIAGVSLVAAVLSAIDARRDIIALPIDTSISGEVRHTLARMHLRLEQLKAMHLVVVMLVAMIVTVHLTERLQSQWLIPCLLAIVDLDASVLGLQTYLSYRERCHLRRLAWAGKA